MPAEPSLQEVSKKYYDAVRNLSSDKINEIEANPAEKPDDAAHTKYCKKCYRALQSFGHGVIDLRDSRQLESRV